MLAAGNAQAYEAIYNQHYLSVFRFAKKIVSDRQVAEDITTDVFVKLWDKKTDFGSNLKLQSFLFTATRNACLNFLRGEKRHASDHQYLLSNLEQQEEKDFNTHPVTEEVYAYLQEEIEKLPAKMRSILQLHLRGLKNEEIALELSIAEKTVRNLKSEAVKLLRLAVIKRGFLYLVFLGILFRDK